MLTASIPIVHRHASHAHIHPRTVLTAFDVAPKKLIVRHLKTALPVVVKNKSGASGKTMNIAENQKPQDGRIYLPGRRLDMRVSILPTVHGESIAKVWKEI